MSRKQCKHRTLGWCFAALLLLTSHPSTADPPGPGEGRLLEFNDAGVIQTVALTFAANSNYRVWTQETTTDDDPVVHLRAQELQSPYNWYHVLSNDDHGSPTGTCTVVPVPSRMTSLDSCLEYNNSAGSSQQGSVILRAYRKQYGGTTRLRVKNLTTDMIVYDQFLAFQGEALDTFANDSTDVVWDANDRFDFAYKAEGLIFPHMLVLRGSEDLVGISSKNGSGQTHLGLWGQPRLQLASASGSAGPGKGNHSVLVGNAFPDLGLGDGSARVYRNDVVLNDTDEDGLGDDLEDYLGTDPEDIDTDHDGFTDALETIGGAHHPECTGTLEEWGPTATDPSLGCAINLGTFGADPVEPTVFVTLIWMLEEDDDDPVNMATLAEQIEQIQAAFAAPTGIFGNEKPVLQLLMDYGQSTLGPFAAGGGQLPYQDPFCQYPSAVPDCDVTYGACAVDTDCPNQGKNWDCVDEVCIREQCNDICNVYDAQNPHPTLGNPHVPWNLTSMYWSDEPMFPLNRRGLSIPMVVYPASVGGWFNNFENPSASGVCSGLECGSELTPDRRKILPGLLLVRQSSMSATKTLMHEIGHALRLGHSVDPNISNRQPNHISVMNYDFGGILGDFGALDYGEQRPSLTMLGLEIEAASNQTECCCGDSSCVAVWANDAPPVDCCPTCGDFNPEIQMCEVCLVDQWVDTPVMGCLYGDQFYQGVTEEECCCGGAPCAYTVTQTPKNWCPPTTTYDDNNPAAPQCRVCNAVWENNACYYGGLDEGDGIGENNSIVEELTHAEIVSNMSCLGLIPNDVFPVGTDRVSALNLEGFPNNIDWNLSNSVSTENPLPPQDLPFRHIGACFETPTPVTATLETHNEWEFLYDHLAIPFAGTQGLGLPPFCDDNFGCPEGWECTSCGWCADPPNVTVPVACVAGLNDEPVACSLPEPEEP